MKKFFIPGALVFALTLNLLVSGCKNPVNNGESSLKTFTVTIPVLQNGYIAADDYSPEGGQTITLSVAAVTNYMLKTDSLKVTRIDNGEQVNLFHDTHDANIWTFTMPNSDVEVTAIFEIPIKYRVNTGVYENGSIMPRADTLEGATVNLIANPASGYKLKLLTVTRTDNDENVITSGTGNIRTFIMPDSAVDVYAEFEPTDTPTYSIIYQSATGGSVSGSTQEEAGALVIIIVLPETGWELKPGTVQVNDGAITVSAVAPYTFSMPSAPVSVSAEFQKKNFTITLDPGIPEGSIVSSKTTAQLGEPVTLTINAPEGYKLSALMVNDAAGPLTVSGTGLSRYFTMPASNVTVYAFFDPISYSIGIGSLSGGSITPGKTSASIGETISLTVSVNPDYQYKAGSLAVNGSVVGVSGVYPSFTFTMPGENVTVTALFQDTRNTIASFIIGGFPGIINHSTGKITVDVGSGLTLTSIAPEILLDSSKATVSPASGINNNFSSGATVRYTVTSESGAVKYYDVTVVEKSAGSITINPPTDETIITSAFNGTIHKNSGNGSTSFSVTVTNNGYSSVKWYVDAFDKTSLATNGGLTLTVSANDSDYGTIGDHTFTVIVYKGDVPYSMMLSFKIAE